MFRLGLVGASRMGSVHLRALSASDSVRVVAVAEPSASRRAALYGTGLTLHADVAAMLRSSELDGVLVTAPSTLHLALVREIAGAGLPILYKTRAASPPPRRAKPRARRLGMRSQRWRQPRKAEGRR